MMRFIDLNPDLQDAPLFPEIWYYVRRFQKWYALKRYGVMVLYPETDRIGRLGG